jgi:hypothetical protein
VCVGTIAVMAAIFFSAVTKAPTYLLPLYPFAAGVIALAATLAPAPTNFRKRTVLSATCALMVVLLVFAAQLTYYNAYHHNQYYAVVLAMAKDEQAIAQELKDVPKDMPVYVYDDQNLGSIEYYSQHLFLLPLTATSTLKVGDYVVLDSSGVPLLAQNFPKLKTRPVYQGPQVSLVEVAD